jgi:hypothetical protein
VNIATLPDAICGSRRIYAEWPTAASDSNAAGQDEPAALPSSLIHAASPSGIGCLSNRQVKTVF